MIPLRQWSITITHPVLEGGVIEVRGDGRTPNEELKDAADLLGSDFKPKQDGRPPLLLEISVRKPDGTMDSIHPEDLKLKLNVLEADITP